MMLQIQTLGLAAWRGRGGSALHLRDHGLQGQHQVRLRQRGRLPAHVRRRNCLWRQMSFDQWCYWSEVEGWGQDQIQVEVDEEVGVDGPSCGVVVFNEPRQLKILHPSSSGEEILPQVVCLSIEVIMLPGLGLGSPLILTFVQVCCKPVSLQ